MSDRVLIIATSRIVAKQWASINLSHNAWIYVDTLDRLRGIENPEVVVLPGSHQRKDFGDLMSMLATRYR